jgi:hypothetical protein
MKQLKTRKLISWISFTTFSMLAITGVVLYFTPQGRIAYWADWRFLHLSKEEWGNIHVIMSMLFLVTAVWHIFLNWKPLVNYLKDKKKKVSFAKPEFVVALATTLVFAGGAYYQLPPFGSALNGLENVKTHWEDKYGAPPWGHAELSSLKTFAKKMGFSLEDSMEVLSSEGFTSVSEKINLKDLARANSTSPKKIMDLLASNSKKNDTSSEAATAQVGAPSGLGKLTLAQMSKKAGVGIDAAISRLAQKFSIQTTADMKVKAIAEQTGDTPMDLWHHIQP